MTPTPVSIRIHEAVGGGSGAIVTLPPAVFDLVPAGFRPARYFVEIKALGLDAATGGARLVTVAEVVGHRSYTGKDNVTRFITTLIYGGGNRELNTAPDHPLYMTKVGEKVLMFEHFLESRFGWKPQGEPQLLQLTAK